MSRRGRQLRDAVHSVASRAARVQEREQPRHGLPRQHGHGLEQHPPQREQRAGDQQRGLTTSV